MFQKILLKNGLTAVFVPASPGSGALSLQFWVRIGSAGEGPLLGSGVAHFLEHMVFKGTKRHSAQDINLRAEMLGGHLNAYTSYDRTVYHIDMPTESIAGGLDLVSDFVFYPLLREEDIEFELEVVLREMAMCNDDPSQMIFQDLMYHGFPDFRSRHPVIGWKERFLQLDCPAIQAFHDEHYQLHQTFVIVAGDLSEKTMEQSLEFLESLIPQKGVSAGQSRPSTLPMAESLGTPAVRNLPLWGSPLVRSGPWSSSQGLLLYPVPFFDKEDFFLGEWLERYLAGGDQSLLHRKILQEKELVHSVDASFFSVGGEAVLAIEYQAEPDLLEVAEQAVIEEIRTLVEDGVSVDVVQEALRGLQFDIICGLQTADGLAERVGNCELLFQEGGEWEFFKNPVGFSERLETSLKEVFALDRLRVGRSIAGVVTEGFSE